MKVKAFIEMLQKADPDDELKAFDPDAGQIESVTGILYAGRDRIVEICTDETD